jgi:hypothetical protein
LFCKSICMENHTVSSRDDPQNLLSATGDLSRRVRLIQRGAWFPLLVFAAVTLAALPFYRYGHPHRHCASTGGGYICSIHSPLALWYWPFALLVAYVATSWFYLHRAHQRGVGTRVRPYVVVGAVLALLTTGWALWADAHPAFLAETLHLGSSQHTDLLYRIVSPAGAIGLALLLLARIERSWPLLTLTVVYFIATVAPVHLGQIAHPSPWAFQPHLLLDGSVLLIGGIILALTQRAQERSTA